MTYGDLETRAAKLHAIYMERAAKIREAKTRTGRYSLTHAELDRLLGPEEVDPEIPPWNPKWRARRESRAKRHQERGNK